MTGSELVFRCFLRIRLFGRGAMRYGYSGMTSGVFAGRKLDVLLPTIRRASLKRPSEGVQKCG